MKKICYLIILSIFVFAGLTYAEDWYEREEASGYDYIGSVQMRVAPESSTAKYSPEYTKSEIKNAITETDAYRGAVINAITEQTATSGSDAGTTTIVQGPGGPIDKAIEVGGPPPDPNQP